MFATVILFFISMDSYLCDLYHRVDAAWFFMCGKAWMSGLVPYVDFADSKGPLLWLIYGIGYLIDHTSYIGVFWISCVWYGLIYFFTYKTARIFLRDDKRALICTILMTFAFFSNWFHYETRAEDFCLLFMVLSLYRVCRLMYTGPVEDKELYWTGGILGACFSALLLIKFNIAAMQSIFILCLLYVLIRERRNVLRPLMCCLAGFAAVAAPFLAYFLLAGNLGAFIQEYFIRTSQTINPPGASFWAVIVEYIKEWKDIFFNPSCGALFCLLIIGGVAFAKILDGEYKWMPLVVSMFVFAITMRHHYVGVTILYYFNICSFLLLFLLVYLLSLSKGQIRGLSPLVLALVTIVMIVPIHYISFTRRVYFLNYPQERYDYYRVAYLMSQVKSPKVISAYGLEEGYGMPAGTLPAGKYWVKQEGMTQEMLEEHDRLINSGKADFIIVPVHALRDGTLPESRLDGLGYKECASYRSFDDFKVFTKWDDLDTEGVVYPSRLDVLLKRTRFVDGRWE